MASVTTEKFKVKLTKEHLKRIIKEELESILEVGGRSGGAGGFIGHKEPARKPILSMGRVEKALKKELGREPSEEEVSAKYAELKATGEYKELGSGPLGRKTESKESTSVVFPDYGMENVAKELQDAYNNPAGGSLSLAPNFSGLGGLSDNTTFNMEDYAYRLESNWWDFVKKIGNKDVAQNIINWIYAYHEFLNPRSNDY